MTKPDGLVAPAVLGLQHILHINNEFDIVWAGCRQILSCAALGCFLHVRAIML